MADNINQSISDLTLAITDLSGMFGDGVTRLVNAIESSACCNHPPIGGHTPTPGIVEGDPPPTGFVEYDPTTDRKCKLANMTFDDFKMMIQELELRGADDVASLTVGSMTALVGIVLGIIASGPVGWGLAALGAIAGVVGVFLVQTVNLLGFITILDNNHEAIVCALYQSTTPDGAYNAVRDILVNAGATQAQLNLYDAVRLIEGLEVLFFAPDDDTGAEINTRLDGYPTLIDCSVCGGPSATGCIFDTSDVVPFDAIVYGGFGILTNHDADIFTDINQGWSTSTPRSSGNYAHCRFFMTNPVYQHPEWGNGANDVYWSTFRFSFTIQGTAMGNITYTNFSGGIGGPNNGTVVRGPGYSSNAYRAATNGATELVTWEEISLGLDPLKEFVTLDFILYYDTNYNQNVDGQIRKMHVCTTDPNPPWE